MESSPPNSRPTADGMLLVLSTTTRSKTATPAGPVAFCAKRACIRLYDDGREQLWRCGNVAEAAIVIGSIAVSHFRERTCRWRQFAFPGRWHKRCIKSLTIETTHQELATA